ncbi:helix-turn-helix domain-containing protein [Dactylosporangium siamense]|uniref:AraC family transcriptional regulator n=1 Tax=Dactylosporangium siamense TaxID=685454 RepID=A0A919U9L4_9ACTN|nr:helix-turn-helix domain-containing protein [Dactylosporangium siamense]GIG43436.1 AraC family transcriptional regulator [Dactylosporangium siamense]
MRSPHRHGEIEVNLVTSGRLAYAVGGDVLEVREDSVIAFWATMPHQLLDFRPGTRVHWLTVPLRTFLGWGVPEQVLTDLLGARPLVDDSAAALGQDPALFTQWARDLTSGPEHRQIAELEIQARLRRLALSRPGADAGHHGVGVQAVTQAAAMVSFVAARYCDQISSADVAAAAHLQASRAMTVFKTVMGTTIGAFVTECRVAQAKRLLITTGLPPAVIAARVGFGSTSRFYAAFAAATGVAPGAYRSQATPP